MNQIELNKESIVALARLVVALAASIATVFGWSLDADLWFNIVVTAIALFCLIRELWWKNNNVTAAAQEAQKITDAIKAGELEGEETTIYVEADEDAVFPGGDDA